MIRGGLLLILLLAGCGDGGREAAADRAYAEGRADEAYERYRALARDAGPELWARLAAAAARAGALDSAALAYARLADMAPARAREAAEGLERIARAAAARGDSAALLRAVVALERVAPGRPIGRFALPLVRSARLADAEAVRLLPSALAAAPGSGVFDSLLLAYGRALEATGDCGGGAAAYAGYLRRGPAADADAVRAGLARCALEVGGAALAAGRAVEAERWLLVAARDTASDVGRRALLGLGDARLAQGDPIAAAIVWQRALGSGADDSIGVAAARRISALGVTDAAGDSARMEEE